jgi:hypothetical protein
MQLAVYRAQTPGCQPTAFSIQVLDIVGGHISAIHVFLDPALFERFGLPTPRHA